MLTTSFQTSKPSPYFRIQSALLAVVNSVTFGNTSTYATGKMAKPLFHLQICIQENRCMLLA